MLAVPGVELALQALALGEQLAVGGRQVMDQGVDPGPEGVGIDAAAGQGLVGEEAVELGRHLKAVAGNTVGHGNYLLLRCHRRELRR